MHVVFLKLSVFGFINSLMCPLWFQCAPVATVVRSAPPNNCAARASSQPRASTSNEEPGSLVAANASSDSRKRKVQGIGEESAASKLQVLTNSRFIEKLVRYNEVLCSLLCYIFESTCTAPV